MVIFEGIVLKMDGSVDHQGDCFTVDSAIELPVSPVTVFYEFNESRPVGDAELYLEGDELKYKIRLSESKVDEQLAKSLIPAVGGRILEREGKLIKRAKITELGISVSGNSDSRIKKLGEP